MDPVAFVREEVRRLKAYHLDLSPCRHKLDQNEVPFDMPWYLKQRMANRLLSTSWANYPDFHSDRLRTALGRQHNWPMEGVLVGNGSNELLSTAIEALVRPGQGVLTTLPSFGLYPVFALRASGVPRFVGPSHDLRLPIDDLSVEIERDPTLPVILCTPNNPTGDAVSPEQVDEILQHLQAPLLLDNAYGEFCSHDYRPLLRRHRHLLIFRTFSKAWSLGGIRLGYLLADPDLVTELIKIKLPYNVGHASALAGEIVLEGRAAAERRVRVLLGRRPQWAEMFKDEGFEVFPSEANFLLVRWPEQRPGDIEDFRQGLEKKSIRVRNMGSYPGLAGCMRVSVGSGVALREVRQTLRDIREELT